MSGTARLLERLSDGQWHPHASLYRDLGVMVHSRSAELRKRGHVIEVRSEWDAEQKRNVYWYRLGMSSATDAACAEEAAGVSVALDVPERSGPSPQPAIGHDDRPAHDGGAAGSTDTHAGPSLGPEQPTLFEAVA
jgi:hypothetical protein